MQTNNSYNNEPLSNAQLMTLAPSIFATRPWRDVSARYTFIPTVQIVEKMRSEGFLPYSASQSDVRIDDKRGFARHLIRFRDARQNAPASPRLGDLYPELVLMNGHDGLSKYKLGAGFFRTVCLNGLIVADSCYSPISVRHTGDVSDIIEASYQVVEQFPKILASVESFQQVRLTEPQAHAFGAAALDIRYDEGQAPISPVRVVEPRRAEDAERTLWNTFNVVQENLTRGGQRGQNPATGRRPKTRRISSIGEDARLNKALWTLTEKMKDLLA